jgi:hypothetical protein
MIITTITKIIELPNDEKALLTINESKKRFHILSITKELKDNEFFPESQKKINEMINQGYELVPFEKVPDHLDKCEIHDVNGKVVSRCTIDLSDNK